MMQSTHKHMHVSTLQLGWIIQTICICVHHTIDSCNMGTSCLPDMLTRDPRVYTSSKPRVFMLQQYLLRGLDNQNPHKSTIKFTVYLYRESYQFQLWVLL